MGGWCLATCHGPNHTAVLSKGVERRVRSDLRWEAYTFLFKPAQISYELKFQVVTRSGNFFAFFSYHFMGIIAPDAMTLQWNVVNWISTSQTLGAKLKRSVGRSCH